LRDFAGNLYTEIEDQEVGVGEQKLTLVKERGLPVDLGLSKLGGSRTGQTNWRNVRVLENYQERGFGKKRESILKRRFSRAENGRDRQGKSHYETHREPDS